MAYELVRVQNTQPVTAVAPPPPPDSKAIIAPLKSLRRHPLIALFTALALFVPAVVLIKAKVNPTYSVDATIYVSPTFIKNLSQDSEQETAFYQYSTFISDEVKNVNRFEILADALASLKSKRSYWQSSNESDAEAVQRLQESLVVARIPDTYQISIGLEGRRPGELADIVNAVANTFVAQRRKEAFYDRPERLQILIAERDKLTKLFDDKSDKKTELIRELGYVSLPAGNSNPFDELLLRRREELAQATEARVNAEAKLQAVDATQKQGKDSLSATAAEIVAGDSGLASVKTNLNRRRSELLTQLSGMAPGSELRKGPEQELAAIDANLKNANDAALQQTSVNVLDRLRADLRRTQSVESQLKAETDELSQKASLSAGKLQQATEIGQDLEQLRTQINTINTRIQYLTIEADAPGFLRVSSYARTPLRPTKDKSIKLIGEVFLASLVAGLLAAILVDLFSPRVDNPQLLENILGFPLLGWVGELPEVRLAGDFAQFRRLAIRLDRAFRENQAKVFFFSAVRAGSGSSFLSNHIGRELARMGHSVVILDANVENPAGSEEVGLVQLLRQELPVDSFLPVVYSDCYRRISLGAAPLGETRLPRLVNMPGLLFELRSKVDFVLIDGAPMLDSPDSEYLSGISDATILVVGADQHQKDDVKKCVQVMQTLRLKSVSAVLNRVLNGRRRQALLPAHQPSPSSYDSVTIPVHNYAFDPRPSSVAESNSLT